MKWLLALGAGLTVGYAWGYGVGEREGVDSDPEPRPDLEDFGKLDRSNSAGFLALRLWGERMSPTAR